MKILKKLLLVIVVLVGAFALVGCGNTKSIIGSWKYKDGGYTYTFNKDKTGSYTIGSTVMKFTYEDDGKKVSILYEGNTIASEYEYKIDGKKLIIKDSFGSDVEYIKK